MVCFRQKGFYLFVFFCSLFFPFNLKAANFTVVDNSVQADAVDANTADGTCATAAGHCTLRAAIMQANALGGSNTITVPAGTYTLTLTGFGENAAATGDLDITSNITINGAGASTTIINGNGTDRIFDISPGGTAITVAINDITIKNGKAPIGGPSLTGSPGGGILITNGSVTLSRLVLSNNFAGDGGPGGPAIGLGGIGGCGGGININGGTVTIEDSTINNNVSGNGGPGVPPIPLGGGGGSGGGICVAGGTVTLNNNTITANTTGSGGGGAPAGPGGAGGGISVTTGTVTLNNDTITGNTTGIGGPGAMGGLGGGIVRMTGTVNLGNSILALNTVGTGGVGPDCNGNITSQGFDLLGNNANCTFSGTDGVNGDRVGTSGSPAEPLFDSAGLANNGGPTKTIAIQATSPAKDTGNNATCQATDQRGETRPLAGPGICDKGAFEIITCGDGAVQTGEACDDGNATNTDACINCVSATCGDGFVQASVEQCDNGAANSNTTPNACRSNCTNPRCGDGVVDTGETCDDGNTVDTDSCKNDCSGPGNSGGGGGGTTAVCGNGTLDSGETCDHGNTTPGYGCSATCTVELPTNLVCPNPTVPFGSLTEGQTVTLNAPDASCGGPALVLAQSSLPATCTCNWGINPTARGTFSAATACKTNFTAGPAGTGQISVAVDCGAQGSGTFLQTLVVNAKPASSSSGGGCSLVRE